MKIFKRYLFLPLRAETGSCFPNTFITDQGTYCYKVMPFGLKNTGTTYQRLVNFMFRPLIGKSMEVYIDDLLVKSMQEADHL